MKIIILWLVSTFFLCAYTNSYTIKGLIRDNVTQEQLAGVSISIDSVTYYSDLNGNFFIPNLHSGKHKIQDELISYELVELEIDLTKDQTLNINLIQYK